MYLPEELSKNQRKKIDGLYNSISEIPTFLIGQIGKNDENKENISGKEIYEGDIVTGFHINAQENIKGFVEHFEKDACFIIKFADGSYCSLSELNDIKVTGNVYTMSPRSKKRK